MTDLATRIEQAGGGCRELDQDIFCDLGLAPFVDGAFNAYHAPAYTTSIDASLTLFDKFAVLVFLSEIEADGLPMATVLKPNTGEQFTGIAATPALALCAAAIRARGIT